MGLAGNHPHHHPREDADIGGARATVRATVTDAAKGRGPLSWTNSFPSLPACADAGILSIWANFKTDPLPASLQLGGGLDVDDAGKASGLRNREALFAKAV
jgi:hypothetical protein